MKLKSVIFIATLSLTLTYNFYSYSQNSRLKVIKTCSEVKSLIIERKSYLQNSISLRKQKNSDIFASLKKIEENQKLDKNVLEELEKFYEESDVLILEREDLVLRLDSLLSLDCEKDKINFSTKLKIFNNNYRNHLRKEIKIREDFEENIIQKLNSERKGL